MAWLDMQLKTTRQPAIRRRGMHTVLRGTPAALAAAAAAACLSCAKPVWAGQVVHDGTLGQAGPLSGPDFRVAAARGKQVGGNLFHSFSKLDLDKGESATFEGPTGVKRVFSRVTGGTPSNIDGMLRCTIPGADFYLVNPSGVVFGPDASLDVSGSFVVTTADVVRFPGGGSFDARTPGQSVLSSAAPEAFGFLGPGAPAAIRVAGSAVEVDNGSSSTVAADRAPVLRVGSGRSITIVGGEVSITGAELQAAQGRVSIVASGGAGEVTLPGEDADRSEVAIDGSALPTRGDITLSDFAFLNVDGAAGGRVQLVGENISLGMATVVSARTTSSGTGRGVAIDAGGELSILGAIVDTSSLGSGSGGDIDVTARSMTVAAVSVPDGPFFRGGLLSDSTGEAERAQADLSVTADFGEPDSFTTVTLTSPSGRTVHLYTDDVMFDATFDDAAVNDRYGFGPGPYRPAQPFGNFVGEPATGLWTLGVKSAVGRGSLDGWSLRLGNRTFAATGLPQELPEELTLRSPVRVDAPGLVVGGTPVGKAGSIRLNVVESLSINDNGFIESNIGLGAAATSMTEINAGSITIRDGRIGSFVYSASQSNPTRLRVRGRLDVDGVLTGISSGEQLGLDVEAGSVIVDGGIDCVGPFRIVSAGDMEVMGSIRARPGEFATPGVAVIDVAGKLTVEGGISSSFAELESPGVPIRVTASGILVRGGGGIATGADQGATAGALDVVTRGDMTIEGAGSSITTGNAGDFNEPVSRGGPLTVVVGGDLIVRDGATIRTTATLGKEGGALTIAAASLQLDGGKILSEGSALTGTSEPEAGRAGDVSLTIAGGTSIRSRGEISSIVLDGAVGGSIDLSTASLLVDGSFSRILTRSIAPQSDPDRPDLFVGPGGPAGGINAKVSAGDVVLRNGAFVGSTAEGAAGGRLGIDARNVLVEGDFSVVGTSTIDSVRQPFTGGGRGGDVIVKAAENVVVRNGGEISTRATGLGRAGGLRVTAEQRVEVDGQGSPLGAALRVDGVVADDAIPSLTVDASNLVVRGNGNIAANSFGDTSAGSLRLSLGGTLSADGAEAAISASSFRGGTGGTVEIRAGRMLVTGGAQVLARNVRNPQTGGTITITAGELTLDGRGSAPASGDDSEDRPGIVAVGGGGLTQDLTLTTTFAGAASAEVFLVSPRGTRVRIDQNVEAGAVTYGDQSGTTRAVGFLSQFLANDLNGAWSLEARSPDGVSVPPPLQGWSLAMGGTQIGTTAAPSAAPAGGSAYTSRLTVAGATTGLTDGRGGSITISGLTTDNRPVASPAPAAAPKASLVSLTGGSAISAGTRGTGRAGSVTVNAESFLLEGAARIESASGRLAASPAIAGRLGDGGGITVNAGKRLTVRDGAIVSVRSDDGDAGDIQLNADDVIQVIGLRSGRSPETNTRITAVAPNGGGGNITLNASGRVLVRDALITAQASEGASAQISLRPHAVVLAGQSELNGLAAGTDVTVDIDASPYVKATTSVIKSDAQDVPVEVDLSAVLSRLSSALASPAARLQDICGMRLRLDDNQISTFTMPGLGGSPPDPAGWVPSLTLETAAPRRVP